MAIVLTFSVLLFDLVWSSTEIRYPCTTGRCDANCSLGTTCSLGAKYPSGANGACWSKARGRTEFTSLACTPPEFGMFSNVSTSSPGVFLRQDLWDSGLYMILTISNFTRSDNGIYRCTFTGQDHLRVTAQSWTVDLIAHPLPVESTTFAITPATTTETTTEATSLTTSAHLEQVLTIEPVQSFSAHSSSHSGAVMFLAIFLVSVTVGILWFLIRFRARSRIEASHTHDSMALSVNFVEPDL